MTLRRELEAFPLAGAEEAETRSWEVVRAAFATRERVPRPALRVRWVVAVALLGAAIVAALSPPGRAVIDSLREAIGVEHAQPALFSLPAAGRIVASGPGGAWVVSSDGSKRRLGHYREAAWSPFGRFLVASGDDELAALEPDGDVRWTLARRGVAFPRWAGGETNTRIAYLSGRRLRVVAGDGTGDSDLGLPAAAHVAPAWRPATSGAALTLAYADERGRVWLVSPVSRSSRRVTPPGPVPEKLAWSSDGRRLLVLWSRALRVYDADRGVVERRDAPAGARFVDASFLPRSHDIAVLRRAGDDAQLELLGARRVLFRTTGALSEVVPSPDGRYVLLAWPAADQWVFVPLRGHRISAAGDIAGQLGGAFPTVSGWCCASGP